MEQQGKTYGTLPTTDETITDGSSRRRRRAVALVAAFVDAWLAQPLLAPEELGAVGAAMHGAALVAQEVALTLTHAT